MIRTSLTLAFLFTACHRPEATHPAPAPDEQRHIEAMAHEHAHDAPVANASAQPPRQEVVAEDVVYGTYDGGSFRGYFARPTAINGPLPSLVVIHEWWGLNDNVRMMSRRLAGEGYATLAVDLYNGQTATTPDAARALMTASMAQPEQGIANLRAAASYLRDRTHAPRLGVLGWCFGGGWSLQAGLQMPASFDAVVMYYGRVVTDPAALAPLHAPLLGLFGADDQGIPVASVREMERALRDTGHDATIRVYDGAGHAFANPSGTNYRPAAADDAWQRVVTFLDQHLAH